MEKAKNILIIILLAVIIFLRTCGNVTKECPEYTGKDTVIVEKWDTVRPEAKIIYLKPKNLTPVASYTINGHLPSFDSTLALKRVYSDSIRDSSLIFYYNIEIIGILTKFEPSYKLFVPLKIIHTINNTITVENKPKIGIFTGLELGGNTKQFNFAPFIAITDKKRNLYSLKYDISNKTVNFAFGIKINK